MVKRGGLALLLVVLVWLAAGCKENGEVVAKVNGRVLTVEDLEEMIPPEIFFQMSREQKQDFANRWIETELLYQAALKRGIKEEEKMRLMLEEAEKQILINEILTREMEEVGDKEVEDYFNLHKEDYSTTVKIAHILLSTEQEAREVLKRLEEGEDFAKLAKEKSLDPSSAQQGGVLGYKKKGDLKALPALEEAAFALKKKGELSGLVKSEYGFHIVKLLDRSPLEEKVSLADVREEIRVSLTMQKQGERVENWLSQLRNEAEIEEHYDVLK